MPTLHSARAERRATRSLSRTGDVIDARYRVEDLLGQGGMAVVYRAFDQTLNRPVALKCLRWCEEVGSVLHALFEREYCTLTQLRHPHIVEVYEYGVAECGAYYTMELLGGTDLRAAGPVDWREA